MWGILLLFSILQVAASCPPELSLIRDGECRGKYTTISTSWEEATKTVPAKCAEIQALPIIIRNNEQQTYWSSFADSKSYVILGLVCSSKNWVWSDGSTVDYKPSVGYDSLLDNKYRCTSDGSWYIDPKGYWRYTRGRSTLKIDVFCTAQLPPLPVPSNECEGFEDDKEDEMCYQIAAPTRNWRDAQRICRNFGAELAAIHNEKENSFIRRLAVSRGEVNGLYLGALGSDNEFNWIDGSTFDYSNFYAGFPVKGLGDCVVMDTQSVNGEWVNVDCSTPVSVACMRPEHSYTVPVCPSEAPKEGDLVFSPGFPFDASTPCDYMLIVDEGKKVELKIVMLEANSCCDRLVVYDNYFGGNIVANLTGEVSNTVYTTASSNIMKVSWQSNGGVNVRGVLMTFRGV